MAVLEPAPRRCSPLVAALADALAWGIALAAVVAGAGVGGDAEPPIPVEPWHALAAAGAVVAARSGLGASHGLAAGWAGRHAVREALARGAAALCRHRHRVSTRRGAATGLGVRPADGCTHEPLGCSGRRGAWARNRGAPNRGVRQKPLGCRGPMGARTKHWGAHGRGGRAQAARGHPTEGCTRSRGASRNLWGSRDQRVPAQAVGVLGVAGARGAAAGSDTAASQARTTEARPAPVDECPVPGAVPGVGGEGVAHGGGRQRRGHSVPTPAPHLQTRRVETAGVDLAWGGG